MIPTTYLDPLTEQFSGYTVVSILSEEIDPDDGFEDPLFCLVLTVKDSEGNQSEIRFDMDIETEKDSSIVLSCETYIDGEPYGDDDDEKH